MDKNFTTTYHGQKRNPHRDESTKAIQDRLQRKTKIHEQRRERHRIQVEECRMKKLEEQQFKSSKERMYFTKDMEKDRRSWTRGMGNASPTNLTSQSSPICSSSRQQYNKAMQKLEKCGRLSAESESSENSTKSESSTPTGLSYKRHSAIYHSSQFQVSDLVSQQKSTEYHDVDNLLAICRICQSDEDSLQNQLVTPCSCTGSLLYVHHLCLQQWRKTKRASGADITKCELCLKNYDTELIGKTDVEPDQTKKMQEDLKRLVRSGVYLMLLVDFCRDSFQDLLRDRETIGDLPSYTAIAIHPPCATNASRREAVYTARDDEGPNSSDENEEYISREEVKRRSAQLNR